MRRRIERHLLEFAAGRVQVDLFGNKPQTVAAPVVRLYQDAAGRRFDDAAEAGEAKGRILNNAGRAPRRKAQIAGPFSKVRGGS